MNNVIMQAIVVELSNSDHPNQVKVRIPMIHGPLAKDKNKLPSGADWTEDKDLPWATLIYPLGVGAIQLTNIVSVNEIVYVQFLSSKSYSNLVVIGTAEVNSAASPYSTYGESGASNISGSLHGSDNEEKTYNYLRNELGLSNAAAAGVIANIRCESSFETKAKGDLHMVGGSFGICQWNYEAGRGKRLESYCNTNKLDYQSLEGQLAYLKYELEECYPGVLRKLRGQESISYLNNRTVTDTEQGAYDAGFVWCHDFEVPEGYEFSTSNSRGNLAQDIYNSIYKNKSPYKSSGYEWPAESYCNAITSYWGDGRGHKGWDIACPGDATGRQILAAADGTVGYVNKTNSYGEGASYGYGFCIEIIHDNSKSTFYAHCSEVLVKIGDIVHQGKLIGRMGNTGNSYGSHLHFETRNGTVSSGYEAYDPADELKGKVPK